MNAVEPSAELAESRQNAILDELKAGGHVVVSRLARELGVSEMTVRRDLRRLEERGLAVRVHGGALASGGARFSDRLSAHARDKAAAAGKLVKYLPFSGCVYLDGSTTMLSLIRPLMNATHLQVATNNAETYRRLTAAPGVDPVLIGGRLDRRTDNLVGPLAERSIESLVFEAAFFSAWGLDPATGLNEVTLEDAEVKRRVAARARSVYVAIDHSKFGVTANGVWQSDPGRSILATDLPTEHESLKAFRDMFSEIV